MARHALPQPLAGEEDFSGHAWNKERMKKEGLNLLPTTEDQKSYISKNAKELAKLFDELEVKINELPQDLERSEENLVKELAEVEKDNKKSLQKLDDVKKMAGNYSNHTKC